MQTNRNKPKINVPALNAKAAPLLTTPPPLYATNPLTGSAQNVLDSIQFYFPAAASQAGLTAAVNIGFKANEEWNSYEYVADAAEHFDPSQSYGAIIMRPQYGILELGNVDPNNQSGNNYTGIDGNSYTFYNIVFPVAIIDVRQQKNIIKTKITGRDGEIKEYIGLNDWSITINTVIDMPADRAPTGFLDAFIKMLTAPVSIPAKNYYLNSLGISNIVIESADLGQAEGGYSSQPLKITACSDTPLTNFLP